MLAKANKLWIHNEKSIIFILTLRLVVNFAVKHLLFFSFFLGKCSFVLTETTCPHIN